MPTDKEIVTTMQENPEKGFRLLMSSYMQPVYWHIRRLVVAHDDAQDATQETFMRVFRAFDQYKPEYALKPWILRIATHEALRLLGHHQGKTMLSLDDEASAELFNLKADEYVDYGDKLAVKLQQAVLTLPVKQQLAFNFRYFDELTYEEIATITDSTAANVKANYHFAKEKIVEYMKNHD